MVIIVTVIGLILIFWWFNHQEEVVTPDPPLNKTCLKCGKKACDVFKPYSPGNPIYGIRCAACGYDNVHGMSSRFAAIGLHNKNVAEQARRSKGRKSGTSNDD